MQRGRYARSIDYTARPLPLNEDDARWFTLRSQAAVS
jgi:hypothetical protein